MESLHNKRVLLGVTGSIAAYKSAELVRRLREAGARVRVVMTASATRFITPLTLQALSGEPVRTELMDEAAELAMSHIELARWADVVLVAPASADTLARLALGRSDDLLGAVCLACEAPLLLAPAMNRAMWANAATRAHVETLAARGVGLLGPATGGQACGETGEGRMLEPADIVAAVAARFETGLLAGQRVLVTAGPTREPVDPVRYLGNRSSGKMGYALARAAAEAGAAVTLVSGPVALDAPADVERVWVETAAQMHAAVMARVAHCDLFIATAAVADYRPVATSPVKIKKQRDRLNLELERTPDILAAVAALDSPPFTVGFAAETDRLEHYALAKLERKRLDLVAANDVSGGQAFGRDDNALDVYWPGRGHRRLDRQPKDRLARQLIEIIAERMHAKDTTQDPGQPTRH